MSNLRIFQVRESLLALDRVQPTTGIIRANFMYGRSHVRDEPRYNYSARHRDSLRFLPRLSRLPSPTFGQTLPTLLRRNRYLLSFELPAGSQLFIDASRHTADVPRYARILASKRRLAGGLHCGRRSTITDARACPRGLWKICVAPMLGFRVADGDIRFEIAPSIGS